MENISSAAAWLLGGTAAASGMVTLVGLAPRIAGAYPGMLFLTIFLIVVGLACGCAAVIFNLHDRNDGSETKHRRRAICSLTAGMVAVLGGTGVLAGAYGLTLNTDDVPRLSLSITAADQPELATVNLEFDADGLNPGQFIVVDLIALPPDVVPDGKGATAQGRRIYRGAIGSDGKGQVTSEVQTVVRRDDVGIVVAEVWPGPLSEVTSVPNNQRAGTKMCGDIQVREIRSCAYADVPGTVVDGDEVTVVETPNPVVRQDAGK